MSGASFVLMFRLSSVTCELRDGQIFASFCVPQAMFLSSKSVEQPRYSLVCCIYGLPSSPCKVLLCARALTAPAMANRYLACDELQCLHRHVARPMHTDQPKAAHS